MKEPPIPENEADRLESVRSLNVLDTPPEERFDRVTRLARRLFTVPIALVTIVDSARQWFKSRQGLEPAETSREVSFCGHTILDTEVMVVPDATADERFHDNPLVVGDPAIRFYAGCPLSAPDGSKVGTICLIDRTPRTLTDDDKALLEDLGQMVEQELAAIQLATVDELTGLSNRRGFRAMAEHALAMCKRCGRQASLLFFDLDHFKEINDTHGHAEGDRALMEMADILLRTFRNSDVVARLGGDEFCVLLTGAADDDIECPLERLRMTVDARNARTGSRWNLAYSVGRVTVDPGDDASVDDLLQEADRYMYEAKRRKRERAEAVEETNPSG